MSAAAAVALVLVVVLDVVIGSAFVVELGRLFVTMVRSAGSMPAATGPAHPGARSLTRCRP